MTALARFLISTWYCYILAIGMTSLFYDYRTNKLRRSRILQGYSLVMNFLTLLLLPFYCLYGMEYMDFVKQKPLLAIVSRCNVISHTLMLFYTLASRYRNDKIFFSLIVELQQLAEGWTAASQQDSSYMQLFYLKYLTMCYQNATIFFGVIYITKSRGFNLKDVLLNLYFLTIWNFLQGTVFCFFLTLMHICRCFKILNNRLNEILQRCVTPEVPFLAISDLTDALLLHRKLQQLLLQLINVYRFHIVTLLLTFMTSNITIGYMTFVFITSMDFSNLTVVFSVVSFFIKFFDIYLLAYCCDETLAQNAEGVFLLRDWHNGEKSGEFDRQCEEFNLGLSLKKLRINICGMFNLDKTAAFGILAETIMQSIIIMQFDYVFK